MTMHPQEEIKFLHDAVNRLTAENARLRAALEWYATTFCEIGDCGKISDDDCSGCRARAVLSQEPQT